jgi:hypothetical protein
MMAGIVAETRVEIIPGQGVTEVVFRRRCLVWRLVRLVLFAAVWAFGLMFGLVLMAAGGAEPSWFMPVWMAGWGLVGLFWIYLMVMNALGVESLLARVDGLTLMRRLLVLRFPLHVAASSLEDLRFGRDNPFRTVRVNGRRIPQTSIEIVTTDRILRCADGIGEADAEAAIAALRQRLPRRRTR